MRQFYKHIYADKVLKQFYTSCELCGKKKYAEKIPVLCRNPYMLYAFEHGQVKDPRQTLYNHKKARSVQQLARLFNHCQQCGKWVCDECYEAKGDIDGCRDCVERFSK